MTYDVTMTPGFLDVPLTRQKVDDDVIIIINCTRTPFISVFIYCCLDMTTELVVDKKFFVEFEGKKGGETILFF